MEDLERYGDYNDIEDDIPHRRGIIGLVLKILVGAICILVVGFLVFRLVLFNTYPDSIKNIYFNDTLTEYYNEKGGNIGALTQTIRAEYDDPDKGNFFCDNLIIIKDINQLQVSVRFNESLVDDILGEYGVELDPSAKDIFSFSLSIIPVGEENSTPIPTGSISYVGTAERVMYHYYKLVFDGVDFDVNGDEEVWIRLEISINGVEMEEPYMILIYENTEEYSLFEEYKLSSKEKPSND